MAKKQTITDYLKETSKEGEELISEAQGRLLDLIKDYQTRFDTAVNSNIYDDFGSYLYNALGNKINSNNKNAVLSVWAESVKGKELIKQAKDSKQDLIKTIARYNDHKTHWEPASRKSYIITHVVTGKKFALAYITPKCIVRTVPIPDRALFFALTQEHVDLISNKDKRICAQEFLNFRDNYIKILKDLNETAIVDVDVSTNVAEFKVISVMNRVSKQEYGRDKDTYISVDKISKMHFNHVHISIPIDPKTLDVYDNAINHPRRYSHGLESRNFGSVISVHPDRHTVMIHNADIKVVAGARHATYFGSINLCEKESDTCLVPSDVLSSSTASICQFVNLKDAFDGPTVRKDFDVERITQNTGFMLDYEDLLNDPKVQKAIDRRIKFFETATKTLEHLKTKHAKLIFLHGLF